MPGKAPEPLTPLPLDPGEADLRDLLGACQLPVSDIGCSEQVFWGVRPRAGPLIGCIALELCGADAILRSLAVASNWRQQGVAKQLLDSAVAGGRQRNLRTLYLLTETAESYFARHGFQLVARDQVPEPVKRTPQFSQICPESAAVMKMDL